MHRSISLRRCSLAVALAAALLTWPAAGYAQLGGILPPPTTTTGTVLGSASAVQATVLGMTTVLSGTGPLGSTNDALDASLLTGGVPSTLTAETLSATAISYADEVDSAASLGNLNMTVAGIGITADFVMARHRKHWVLQGVGVQRSLIFRLMEFPSPSREPPARRSPFPAAR